MPADAVKVSVIVPVFNPGEYIDDCITSLLGQSLKPHEYEAIFVDDGSTDGTAQRLDRLAERHEQVRVEHIPNSGWPGRPRNVGIDMARGEFLYFVDNDDWLTPKALERLYEMATRDRSDIVIGKVVGHGGRSVSRALFERNRSGVTVDWPMLMRLLTPHKLFRKSFLDEHGLRFPEGRRRLED
ncbi:MAG TPA: glycosyltransferase family 2 protein, partial [Thermoleophilaceae bacterium]|nr:glycosyltransferase family 2 protein [Thermoleophilaceae bacterium]